MNKTKLIKYFIPVFIFFFIFTAHFYITDYTAYQTQSKWVGVPVQSPLVNYINNQNIFLGYAYALSGMFAVIYLLNLIIVHGNLKKSIRGITISAVLWASICFIAGCCGSPMLVVYLGIFGSKIIGITKPLTAGITTITVLLTFYYIIRFKNKNIVSDDTTTKMSDNNPYQEVMKYPLPSVIKQLYRKIIMTVFRLFPNPAPLGIYKFGNPDKNSPVFITSNYVLTVDRVAKSLQNIDCYLIVADGKGINVWCSSGAGHFNNQTITDAITLSNIGQLVNHRKIILPQLSAVNIYKYKLEKSTGWKFYFGPVYIEDIKKYLANNYKKDRQLCSTKFNVKDRIEMSIGCSLIAVFLVTCIMIFVDINSLKFLVPLIYIQSIIFAVIEPYIPIKHGSSSGIIYSIISGSIVMLIRVLLLSTSFGDSLVYIIPLMITGLYLPNEFLGWSPLLKYNWQMLLKGYWSAEISVDREKCIGCGLCVDVCPVNVFKIEHSKSEVINENNCEGCKACFRQCPVDAIEHTLKTADDKCACVYCNVQTSISSTNTVD